MDLVINRRNVRAKIVASYVLKAIEPFMERFDRLERKRAAEANESPPPNPRRGVYRAIFDALYVTGVEVITDADRAMAGLDERDQNGLTEIELRILEDRYHAAMRAPVQIPIEINAKASS